MTVRGGRDTSLALRGFPHNPMPPKSQSSLIAYAHSDPVRQPRARQDQEQRKRRHRLTRSAFASRAGLAAQVLEDGAADEPEDGGPAGSGQDHVEDDEAGRRIDQGDGEREEDPTDDVVCAAIAQSVSSLLDRRRKLKKMLTSDSGREDDDADMVLEQPFVGQDPREDRERRDRVRRADEEQERAKLDAALRVDESVVQALGDGGAERKGDDHADQRDRNGEFRIAAEEREVDLETDEEEEPAHDNTRSVLT